MVLFPKLTVILTALALSACVAGGPGAKSGGKAEGPNPVTGSAIEVTALDDPAAKADRKPGSKPAEAAKPAVAAPAPDSEAKPKPRSEADPAAKPAEETPPTPDPAAPQVEKSAEQLACEKKGNSWSKVGTSGASACVKRLKDGGKRCTSGTQCQGDCLARSNTCAPMTPLFGCNEILQDNGVRVTLCLD